MANNQYRYNRTIIDNFASLAAWSVWSSQVSDVGGQMVINFPNTLSVYGADDLANRDLNNAYIGVKVVTAASQDQSGRRVTPVIANTSSGNSWSWRLRGGQCQVFTQIGGTSTQVGTQFTYNPSVHVYFAVGINDDGDLQWMWSTDAELFTVHYTQANPFGTTVTDWNSILQGQDGTSTGTAQSVFDEWSIWTPKPIKVNARLGGAWVPATPKVRIGGAWVTAVPNARIGGSWVEAY